MRFPFSPLQFFLFVFLLLLLFTLIQVGLVHIAADKLGISPTLALLGLFLSLTGSMVNIPLFSMRSLISRPADEFKGWLLGPRQFIAGRIIVAINLGGAIMPLLFCIYLYTRHQLGFWQVLVVSSIVTVCSFLLSRPIPRLGIAMPVFVPPACAALTALLIAPEQSAPLAYTGGTVGVILGADILRLRNLQQLGAPMVSIGGAGTFDGIFLTGVIAVLLA